MGMPESRPDFYTYGDYLKWPADERWELIEGRAYAMTPPPLINHQRIAGTIFYILFGFFEGKPCEVFASPTGVLLPRGDEADEAVDTVVEPDVLVVCDPNKVKRNVIHGAPDLVFEALSESTMLRDIDVKLRLYERHGVRCYIIADPWQKTLTVRYLEAPAQFGRPELFSGDDPMPVKIFEGLVIDLARIFKNV